MFMNGKNGYFIRCTFMNALNVDYSPDFLSVYTIFEGGCAFSSRLKDFRGVLSCSNRLDAVYLLGNREGWHRSVFDII